MRNPDQNLNQVEVTPAIASSESFYAALSDIGQLLVRSLDPPVLYEAVIAVLERRIGAMLVMIGEVDRGSGWFQRVAPVCVPPGKEDIYPERLPFSLAQLSFWQGTPQLETDVRHKPGLETFRRAYLRHGVVSTIAVPVMKFGEVRAGLVIRSSHVGFFSPEMIELLQQAAASIGLGLEAYEQRTLLLQSVRDEARQRRALRLLSEMVKVVTHSVDEQRLLADACRVVKRTGSYPLAWIGLLQDDARQVLQLRAHEGLGGKTEAGAELSLADASHVDDAAVAAVLTGRPGLTTCVSTDHVEWPLAGVTADLRALLALPLSVNGDIVGVLVIGAIEAAAFASVEVQVFSEMAVELGLGIQMQRAQAARLLAEQELRFNLQHFQTVLSNQYAGILVMSQDGQVKFANEAF
ncbi:MAG: GAF domain-containing protein, partial [Rhodanobacter sp.]